MSYAPVVPPLPQDFNAPPSHRQESRPPIPPLPPNFQPEQPLAAPTPERIMPSLPADMARTLDESMSYGPRAPSLSPYPGQDPYRRPSPAPPAGYPGGFVAPSAYGAPPRTGPSPVPYATPPPRTSPTGSPYGSPGLPPGAAYGSPPGPAYGSPPGPGYGSPPVPNASRFSNAQHHYSLPAAMTSLAVSQPPPRATSAQPYPSSYPLAQSPKPLPPASPPTVGRTPELTARIPTLDSLIAAQRALPPHPTPEYMPWIRDVLFLVDRVVAQNSPTGNPHEGPVSLPDPTLARLANDAVAALHSIAAANPPPEAIYLRGTLHSSGAFPAIVPHSPRDAFRDFEHAARAGFVKAWFKIGRDYEAVGDAQRARDCFERGLRGGVESCFYRMGMAHLLGQLGLPAAPQEALPLLHRAATLASTETPQPAYVYGLLLLGEFSHIRLEERVFAPLLPAGSTPAHEARKFVERAAFLGFAPAQYKLGHAYEYAVPPFPFDPLLSVQYYSLASQQGEPEADMALSKWFLCGAEGAFDKDEALALTFADKAARKGLGSAEFAMGYYAEVGVGGRKDVDAARKWYAKAVEHGNTDAPERLAALSQPTPQALSRTEHDAITDAKLVRKRTQARITAQAAGRVAQQPAQGQGQGVIGRIQAQAQAQAHAGHGTPEPAAHQRQSSQPPLQHQQQPSQHQQQPSQHQQQPPQHQQQPSQHQQHVSQHQQRYSLSDTGASVSAPAPASGQGKPASGRPAGRPPGRRPQTSPPPAAAAPASAAPTQSPALPPPTAAAKPSGGGGAATFAEMGFQPGKAADKECVIM